LVKASQLAWKRFKRMPFFPPILNQLVGDAEIEAFFSDTADLQSMLAFEAALARAEAKFGFIPVEAAHKISEVCADVEFDLEKLALGMEKDGVVVPELIRQLRERIGEPYARYAHFGATSQDAIDTSLLLRLKTVLSILQTRLERLIDVLHLLSANEGLKPLMAHTRMQQALPFTLADKLKTWIAPLQHCRLDVNGITQKSLVIQFGGPIGNRGDFGDLGAAVAQALAEELQLNNASPWHTQRWPIVELGSWFSRLSGVLGKIGQDIALMAQNERHEVRLSCGGTSSAMPHKSNPVAAEILVSLARFNSGLIGLLHQALVHENERSGAAWTLEWLVLPQMAVAAAAGLRLSSKLCDELQFD
jgi:3-carboxy-cis,cis-muconate cycloisomerase